MRLYLYMYQGVKRLLTLRNDHVIKVPIKILEYLPINKLQIILTLKGVINSQGTYKHVYSYAN